MGRALAGKQFVGRRLLFSYRQEDATVGRQGGAGSNLAQGAI